MTDLMKDKRRCTCIKQDFPSDNNMVQLSSYIPKCERHFENNTHTDMSLKVFYADLLTTLIMCHMSLAP